MRLTCKDQLFILSYYLMYRQLDQTHNVNRTAIREINLDSSIEDIQDLWGYPQAFIVFRFKKAVIGQVWLPVVDGRISSVDLQSCLGQFAWPLWYQWFKKEGSSPIIATVVVCTRNRSEDLAKGLPKLARLAGEGHEVLIVDNCPDDDLTRLLVSQYPAVHYILEPKPGLDTARNRCLRTAREEIVAFTDDDAIVDDEWLSSLLRNFQDPTVAVVTGITMPLEIESEAQYWFEVSNSFKRGFLRKRFEASTMDVIAAGQVGAGVNMAIRKSALGEIGYFDEALDAGMPTMSGGDQEFFYRTLAAGYRIIYDPAALVWHRHRRSWEELRKTLHGYGVGVYAWWTCAFIVEGEFSVPIKAARWFFEYYVRNLFNSIFSRANRLPIDLTWAEFRGALSGPFRYYQARNLIHKRNAHTSKKMQGVTLNSSREHPQPSARTDFE